MPRDPHPHSPIPARPEPPAGMPSEAPLLSVHAAVVFLAAVIIGLVMGHLMADLLPPTTAAEQHTTAQPAPKPICPTGPDAVMRTSSKVLTEDHTVEDGRARLLHKSTKKPTVQDTHRRLRRATLTEALRQRTLLPTAITPIGKA